MSPSQEMSTWTIAQACELGKVGRNQNYDYFSGVLLILYTMNIANFLTQDVHLVDTQACETAWSVKYKQLFICWYSFLCSIIVIM